MSILALSLLLTLLPAAPPPLACAVSTIPPTPEEAARDPRPSPMPEIDPTADPQPTPWLDRVLAAPADLASLFDNFHGFVSRQLIDRSDAIDRFFGDAQIEDDTRVALLRFRQEFVQAEGGELFTRSKLTARVPFPRIEERFRIVIDTTSDEDELIGDTLVTEPVERESLAGVEYAVPISSRSSANLDLGGKFDGGFKTRTELKLKRTWLPGDWRVRILEGLHWRDGEGFGERTRLDFDRSVGSLSVLRSRTEAEWSETSRGVDLDQRYSVTRALSVKTALSGTIGVELHTRPSWIVDGYSAEIRVRRQLHRKWLFLQMTPRADFPRDRRYEFTPQLVISIEIRFGEALPSSRAR